MTRAQATRTTLLNQWERCSDCGGLEWREYDTILRWGGETIVFSHWVCADCEDAMRRGCVRFVADFDRERRCFPTRERLRARLAKVAS